MTHPPLPSVHDSDCAVHNAPALPPGPCDCGIAPHSVEASFLNLLVRIQSLKAPRIIGEPDGNDLRDVADHMVQVADAVDAYFEQIGRMVQANAPVKIDQRLFKDACFQAVAGNAIFEISRAAEALDQECVS